MKCRKSFSLVALAMIPRTMRLGFKAALFGVMLCLLGTAATSQDITATISGEVKDPQGAVIAKAKVTLTNTDTNVVVKTIETNSSGDFVFPGLQVGHYAIAITSSS